MDTEIAKKQDQIKAEWTRADKNGDDSLSYKEIKRLLEKLQVKMPTKEVKRKFQTVDVDKSKTLSFNEFCTFYERLQVRPEIDEIFDTLAGSKGYMTPEEFASFIQKTQKETVTIDDAAKLIAQHESKLPNGQAAEALYCSGFAKYIASISNSIFNPNHKHIHHDMSQPFCHYFIASSHNTYLLADQLKGDSSVEAYKFALKKGCRCVELDCWDGSDKEMPIIYHGHTLTSKITFKEVLETIRDFGFTSSEYPVILSLEVHCNLDGQRAMARLIQEVLGTAGLLPDQPDSTGVLPSPDKLKKKVLLKGKMVNFKEDDSDEEVEADSKKKSKSKSKSSKSGKEEAEDSKRSSNKSEQQETTVAKELSSLIHLKAVSFKSFQNSKETCKPWEMSSFSEGKITNLINKTPLDVMEYNRRQLSRIYPKGMRIDSSNYDPTPSWNYGCQIVALNYQTASEPTFLNDAKFMEDNGGCGYLLKPKALREVDPKFNPYIKPTVQKTIIANIISGWKLPKVASKTNKGEIIDPYVKVIISGAACDKRVEKTKTITNNGYNPTWRAQFKIPLCQPEFAVLLFVVMDSDFATSDDIVAQYGLPVNSIREGYRYVPLRNRAGEILPDSSLLVNFQFA